MKDFFGLFSGRSVRTFTFAIAATAVIALAPQAGAAGSPARLVIGGTGTALGGMQLLAKAFSEDHPEIKTVVLPSLGSGGGIKALDAGKIDLALSARPLKDKESAKGLSATLYARTPIVFATHKKTPSGNVTLSELPGIYSGATSKWQDGTPLRLILRPEQESDTQLLRGLSRELDAAIATAFTRNELLVAVTDQDNASALETIPGSLGLTTLAQILSESRNLKPLTFDGQVASVDGLHSGDYPYCKTLYLVVGKDPSEALEAFVTYVFSKTGRDILTATGHDVAEPGR
ncbi:substrate-binding domain-containing protein [Roseibium aggregatum]|uniref:ABC transporter substrate-binding protein n=1 Tax=Roseibium aggregatum TaxID=187304 RepID=A0A926S407_9HYPH|nr:substrate-binding domain-containing protein [Roseibium aggregatum]MBD1545858.1 ABC transporter substrate-binding protein [Roseibium aggregatum]